MLGRSRVYPVGVLHHYLFIIAQLWLISHLKSTMVLLNTGTPGTSREIFSEDADGETRNQLSNDKYIMMYTLLFEIKYLLHQFTSMEFTEAINNGDSLTYKTRMDLK